MGRAPTTTEAGSRFPLFLEDILNRGGLPGECTIQVLRRCDSQVFKTNSQVKLQGKSEAPEKLNRQAANALE